jgi:hypothetical protein
MTATRFIPVHLPELADCEAPAPAHEGRPRHVSPFSAPGTTAALWAIHHRGVLIPGDADAIFAAIRLLEVAMKRGLV